MKKKVIFSAGGTGGHLFPAQATARSLPECEVLFVAAGLEQCPYFERTEFPSHEISSATFRFSRPLSVLKKTPTLVKGIAQSHQILRRFRPDLVVGFGSFHTLPLLVAAKMQGIPIILHEQNAIPGKVNRLFAPLSKEVATTFPQSHSLLKGSVTQVAYPLRERKQVEKTAWDYFRIDSSKPILLIFGGSQGAKHLNEIVRKAAPELGQFTLLHFTGKEEETSRTQEYYKQLGLTACVKTFEPNMHLAMEVASLAVCRAGASTIAELIDMELPALLIPFPYASENHQVKNGAHFVTLVQGGQMIEERDLTVESLVEAIKAFSPEYKRGIQSYKANHALPTLSHLILEHLHD